MVRGGNAVLVFACDGQASAEETGLQVRRVGSWREREFVTYEGLGLASARVSYPGRASEGVETAGLDEKRLRGERGAYDARRGGAG